MIGENDLTIPAKMMDLCALQHKLTAHNIANADVKDFHKVSADFQAELRGALESGDAETVKDVQAKISRARETGVDSEAEVARMVRNELMFNTFAEVAATKFRILRSAITNR